MSDTHSLCWYVNGGSPHLNDGLEYLQVITKHLPVVMVTVTHDELQHMTHQSNLLAVGLQ